MKKIVMATVIAIVMLLCGVTASAVGAAPDVRVNADIVAFPDAQPFVDGNCRTLIPVRFVSEALGANVTWEQSTATAVIEQNGITVRVPIGSDTISVTKDGSTTTVKMDTAAVAKQERTYVPIRFVAEALGACVDYSNAYNTVQICNDDVLTGENIKDLRAVERTVNYSADTAATDYTGEYENVFGNTANTEYGFANAYEYVLRTPCTTTVTDDFEVSGKSITHDNYSMLASGWVAEAEKYMQQNWDEYTSNFYSTEALICSSGKYRYNTVVVRGVLVIDVHQSFDAAFDKLMADEGLQGLTKGTHKYVYDITLDGTGNWHFLRAKIVSEIAA